MTLTELHEELAVRSFSDNAICEFCLSTITTGQRDRDELISTCTQCAVRKGQMPKDTSTHPAHRSAADAVELDTYGYIDRRPVSVIEHEERNSGGQRRAVGAGARLGMTFASQSIATSACAGCGKSFVTRRSDAKYCKSGCRQKTHRRQ